MTKPPIKGAKKLPRHKKPPIKRKRLVMARAYEDAKFDTISDGPTAYTQALLHTALQVAVPLWIERVRGWLPERRIERAHELGQIVAEKGDILQFKSKKQGGTAAVFNALAEGLACIAFSPGGVKFLGLHWEVT